MPEYLAPGVYVEEVGLHPSVTGLPTGITGFVGLTVEGALEGPPTLVLNFTEFRRAFGKPVAGAEEAVVQFDRAVRLFFENGGARLYVARVAGWADLEAGLARLETLTNIEIVAAPGSACLPTADARAAARQALIDHCETARYRIAVLASGANDTLAEVRLARARHETSRAALYHPWLVVDGAPTSPEGAVAGIYVRTSAERGVQKAPANEVVRGATGFTQAINKAQQDVLNPEGVNALRFFEGRGNLVWGARTLSTDPEWKYVNVRRYMNWLEHSLDAGTQWAVFEPNDERLWAMIRQRVGDFLHNTWRDGGLPGTRPEDAYFVRCNRSTMTQTDIDAGRLVCLIGVAMLKPAEFVIFRIGQKTADAQT